VHRGGPAPQPDRARPPRAPRRQAARHSPAPRAPPAEPPAAERAEGTRRATGRAAGRPTQRRAAAPRGGRHAARGARLLRDPRAAAGRRERGPGRGHEAQRRRGARGRDPAGRQGAGRAHARPRLRVVAHARALPRRARARLDVSAVRGCADSVPLHVRPAPDAVSGSPRGTSGSRATTTVVPAALRSVTPGGTMSFWFHMSSRIAPLAALAVIGSGCQTSSAASSSDAPANAADQEPAVTQPAHAPAHGHGEHGAEGVGHGAHRGVHLRGAERGHAAGNAPERDASQKPDEIYAAMGIEPGDTVVDLGAGTGYLIPKLSTAVGPEGAVLAADIEPKMLAFLDDAAK